MSHKEQCVDSCIEYLNARQLAYAFDFATFNHYYRKHNGATGNAYHIGVSAADMMIENYKPKIEDYERRNESQTAAA